MGACRSPGLPHDRRRVARRAPPPAAMDASSDLLLGERRALATLATAVEARAGQRAGAKVDGASAEAAVTEALMALDDVLRKSGAGSGEDA